MRLTGSRLTKLEHLASRIAVDLSISLSALRGPSRRRELVLQRYEVMRRCREAGYKLTAIADYFNRHHSVVVYATNPDRSMIKRAKMRKRAEVNRRIKALQAERGNYADWTIR